MNDVSAQHDDETHRVGLRSVIQNAERRYLIGMASLMLVDLGITGIFLLFSGHLDAAAQAATANGAEDQTGADDVQHAQDQNVRRRRLGRRIQVAG
ncbi:MAG: hypothetical protein AAF684_09420, partial [Pseudomonadota bacterium]